MGGGLMQLVAYGAQDIYLKNPVGQKNVEKYRKNKIFINLLVDFFIVYRKTTDVNQGIVKQLKNPGEKIKLLGTPKAYFTKNLQ